MQHLETLSCAELQRYWYVVQARWSEACFRIERLHMLQPLCGLLYLKGKVPCLQACKSEACFRIGRCHLWCLVWGLLHKQHLDNLF